MDVNTHHMRGLSLCHASVPTIYLLATLSMSATVIHHHWLLVKVPALIEARHHRRACLRTCVRTRVDYLVELMRPIYGTGAH